MGLIGMARRAGAAQGAYLAAQEAYHRQRQGLYDDMALRRFGMDQQRFDMDRQKFQNDLADREIKNKRDAETHQWAGETHKDNLTTNIYRRDALRAQERSHNAQTQALENRTKREDEIYKNYTSPYNSLMLELAKGRLDAQDYSNEQNEINRQRQNAIYNQRMAAMNRMSPQERDNYLLYGANRYNPSLAQMTQSGRKSTSSGKAKPPFSDTRIENIAAHATPDQMKNVFDQVYNITDKDMLRKTGKTRDQYLKDANDDYAEHIRTQGANAMSREEFLEQRAKQYGFRPIYDLNKYMNAINDDATNEPSAMGNWWREYVYGTPYGTYHYQRKNPTIYKKQKDLVAYITAASKGESPKDINSFIRTPRIARIFMDAMDNGIPTKNAKKYVFDQYRRGAR